MRRAFALVIAGGILMTVGYNEREAVTSGTGVDRVRLTDPATGAGLFTTNTDPNAVGIDPLTDEEAPAGTDVGFGRMLEDRLADGLYNGGFRVGPPDPTLPLDGDTSSAGYNLPPYWGLTSDTAGAIVTTWEDGTITMTAAAVPDVEAYLWQVIPVSPEDAGVAGSTYSGFAVSGGATSTGVDPAIQIGIAYLDEDGAVIGSEETASEGFTTPFVVTCNLPVAPSNAAYVRFRVGLVTSGAANAVSTGTILYAGVRRAFDVALFGDTLSTDADDRPGRIFQEDGDLFLFPSGLADAFSPRANGAVVIGYPDGVPDVPVGGLALAGIVYEDLTSNEDDYEPSHGPPGTWETLALTPDANRTLGGLVAPARIGTQVTIMNMSGSNSVVLEDQATSGSSAANRFALPNNANLTIRPRGGVTLRYLGEADGVTALRWRATEP